MYSTPTGMHTEVEQNKQSYHSEILLSLKYSPLEESCQVCQGIAKERFLLSHYFEYSSLLSFFLNIFNLFKCIMCVFASGVECTGLMRNKHCFDKFWLKPHSQPRNPLSSVWTSSYTYHSPAHDAMRCSTGLQLPWELGPLFLRKIKIRGK